MSPFLRFLLPWIASSWTRHGASWISGVLASSFVLPALTHVFGSNITRGDIDGIGAAVFGFVAVVWSAYNKGHMVAPAVQERANAASDEAGNVQGPFGPQPPI